MAKIIAKFRLSSAVLILANLVALYGIFEFGWNVFPVILLYWLENLVIGILNVARMLCAAPEGGAGWPGKLGNVAFFCLHYGMFWAIHGSLLLAFFGGAYEPEGFSPLPGAVRAVLDHGLVIAVAAIAASHLFSLVWNYLRGGEFRHASLSDLMEQPYHRVLVMHAVVLAAGFAVEALDSPLWALVPLVVLKIFLDAQAHEKEHAPRVSG